MYMPCLIFWVRTSNRKIHCVSSSTKYEYDEKTFRLKKLFTTRNNGTDVLQDLNYEYDPVGNITEIIDSAQEVVFFDNQIVKPSQTFKYDALYRLIEAKGREHINNGADTGIEINGYPNVNSPIPNDATALRNYTRKWEYDGVGNILQLIHAANNGNWNRSYNYASNNNRLNNTTVGQATVNYSYNAHGSMASMPHLHKMEWDFAERLSHVKEGSTDAHYNYDGSGERVRKVVKKGGIVETRLYLEGFEIFRKKSGNTLVLERETLHVMDDVKRIAVVETLTVDNGSAVTETPVLRYQLGNNIESATLELDENASIISYEEYYPYGDTSYQAGRSASEVSQKRYRYTGKEKDDESGLYYHGARYYACWLGRWTAVDPAGLVDGVNLYLYCRGNPVTFVDDDGRQTESGIPFNLREELGSTLASRGRMEVNNQQLPVNTEAEVAEETFRRRFGEGNTVGAVLKRQAIRAVGSGNNVGVHFWSATAAAWETFGFETISTVTDKMFNTGEEITRGDVVFAGFELTSVVPIGRIGTSLGILRPTRSAESLARPATRVTVGTEVTRPIGWRVGGPIHIPTSAGREPAWSTVRQRYWKNEAHYNPERYPSVGQC
jgi:RHS repeat-associated protein